MALLIIVLILLAYFAFKGQWRNLALVLLVWGLWTTVMTTIPTVIHWGEGGEWTTLAITGFAQAIVCLAIGSWLFWKYRKSSVKE